MVKYDKQMSDFEQIKNYYITRKENREKANNNYKMIKLSVLLKPLFFVIFAVLIEILNFRLINWSWNNFLPTNFALEFGVILVLASVLALITNKKAQNIVFYFLISLMTILSIVNLTLLNKQGIVFNFSMLGLLGEATKAFNADFLDVKSIVFLVFELVLIIICQVQLDRLLNYDILCKKNIKVVLPLVICLIFSGVGSLFYVGKKTNLTRFEQDLYVYQTSTQGFMQKFGTFSILSQPINITKNEVDEENILSTIEENDVAENKDALLYGDNLIMVMLESFDTFAIDPYNTPTLYKILNDGVYATNYYSNNKTNISEFISLNGYVPNLNSVLLNGDNDLSVKYSLPNLFKKLGYSATYFHSYDGEFYNRNTLNVQMGFDDVIDCYDAGIPAPEFNFWNFEQDYLDSVITQLAPNDGSKFMSFYLTVATHGSYENDLENFHPYEKIYDSNLEDYKQYLEDNEFNYPEETIYQDYLRRYKSRVIETDRMVKNLMDYLYETGLIENTSLVFFGDHNAYYHNLTTKIKTNENSTAISSYNVPMVFYSKKLQSKKITDFSTVTDIYATICGLYGLPYNKIFNQGNNLFDESEHEYFMFAKNSGYYNDKFYGINLDSITPLRQDDEVTEEDYDKFVSQIKEFTKNQIFLIEIYNKKLTA